MNLFFAFVKKEFRHILRDKRTMLILFGMPIVQIVLFGFALSTEVHDVQTAVLAPSFDNTYTRNVIDRLDASEYFTVKYIVGTPEEMEALFEKNKIELAIVFPPRVYNQRWDDTGVQIVADATDPNQASTRSAYANIILSEARNALSVNNGSSAVADTWAGKDISSHPQVSVYTKMLYNPRMLSAYNFVPGVMGLILMLICAMMTSISIVREKERGTMEILLVSPTHPFFVVLSKAVPYLTLSIVIFATILLLSVFVLGVPIAGNLFTLCALSLLFLFVCLSLGLLISCVTHTQVAAMLASGMVLMVPTIILSGIIYPIESMPGILQAISTLFPARWYVDIVRKVMIEGVPFVYVWKQSLILGVMGVVLITLTVRLFKDRLE